jgi:hypothetical protein
MYIPYRKPSTAMVPVAALPPEMELWSLSMPLAVALDASG